MLRVAIPNKGSLSEPATVMMREAGYSQRRDPKELVLTDAENGVEFFYLRPRDVAVYVGRGTVDLGITGRDLLLDSGSTAVEVMPLGFASLALQGISEIIKRIAYLRGDYAMDTQYERPLQ